VIRIVVIFSMRWCMKWNFKWNRVTTCRSTNGWPKRPEPNVNRTDVNLPPHPTLPPQQAIYLVNDLIAWLPGPLQNATFNGPTYIPNPIKLTQGSPRNSLLPSRNSTRLPRVWQSPNLIRCPLPFRPTFFPPLSPRRIPCCIHILRHVGIRLLH
jgi:hypothetical protein